MVLVPLNMMFRCQELTTGDQFQNADSGDGLQKHLDITQVNAAPQGNFQYYNN